MNVFYFPSKIKKYAPLLKTSTDKYNYIYNVKYAEMAEMS